MTGNRKKAEARHEPMVDKRVGGLRSYCDNRGNHRCCRGYADAKDEIRVKKQAALQPPS